MITLDCCYINVCALEGLWADRILNIVSEEHDNLTEDLVYWRMTFRGRGIQRKLD